MSFVKIFLALMIALLFGGIPAMSASTMTDILAPGAKLERVATGFQFTEGPVWMPDGYLVFSDIPASKIYRLTGDKGEIYREPSGNSNGLTLDTRGRLIACEHGNRRVSREEEGKVVAIAEQYQGKRLNSPNDVVVRSDGSIFFTDPPYGVSEQDRELDFQGVYRLYPKGELTLLTKSFDRPNGVGLSPDEKTLYVTDSSQRSHIKAFDLEPDGSITNERLFATLKGNKPGVPDGLKVDKKGNVYSTGPGGIWIFTPEGKHVGTIDTPEVPANCAWGDKDHRTLYITAQKSIYQIRCRIGGR